MSIQNMIKAAEAKAAAAKRSAKAVSAGVETLKRVEALAAPSPAAKMAEVRGVVAALPAASVKFLMKIDEGMRVRLEKERARRGLRSRVETIRALLEEALSK